MKAKIYTKDGEKEVVIWKGEVSHSSPIIELYKDGEWMGNMGIWIDGFNGVLHIYFPSIETRLQKE